MLWKMLLLPTIFGLVIPKCHHVTVLQNKSDGGDTLLYQAGHAAE